MSRATPCPSCGLPFNHRWIKIAASVLGESAAPSFICPRCTMGRVGLAPVMDLPTAYGVRGLPGEIDVSGLEHPDTGAFMLTTADVAASLRRRLSDVGLALQIAKTQSARQGSAANDAEHQGDAKPRLLHVGSGEGALLSWAARKFDVDPLGLEPWKAWYERAEAAGVPTLDLAPELLETGERFDVIVEHHLLMRVPHPRDHLRSLARRLAPHGVLVLEVPNLLAAPRPLEEGFLSVTRPHLFTARSLRNLCHKVDLVPVHVSDGTELRVFCRHRLPDEKLPHVADGPRVRDVVEAIHGNDLRIKLKRGLTTRGPVPALIEMAERILAKCKFAPTKADLAIEVAKTFERHHDWAAAARWLRESLTHRADADVACMAVRCETLARALQRQIDVNTPADARLLFQTAPVERLALPRN